MHQALITVDALQREQAAGTLLCLLDASFDLARPSAGQEQFEQAHIPGARYVHLDEDLSGPKTGRNGRHPLPDLAAFAARARSWGVVPGVQVVAMDRGDGAQAARLWWMLRWMGHGAVAVLDGGLRAWQAAGAVVESGPAPAPLATPGDAPVPSGPGMPTADAAQVLAWIGDPAHVVVDARGPARFRGETEPLDPVAGHIPGALNHPHTANLQPDGRFKPADELRAQWLALLAGRPPSALVHQCGSGVTASHNLLALATAGLDGGMLYPGSWSEWCADPARPVARG